MIRITLEGTTIDSEERFHSVLRSASGAEWYGGNLDALFDLLVGVIQEPVEIIWTDASRSRVAIGERFDRLIAVIFDAIAYRGPQNIVLRLQS